MTTRKLLLVGDASVGKTSLMLRFCKGHFKPSIRSTVGLDFCAKAVRVQGQEVKLQVWDTAGSERFRSISRAYYRRCQGILLVYSVTDLSSFAHLDAWLRSIRQYTAGQEVAIQLVGTKTDMGAERVVPMAMAEAFAEKHGILHCVTSAKDDELVQECFMDITTAMLQLKERDVGRREETVTAADLTAGMLAKNRQKMSRASCCC